MLYIHIYTCTEGYNQYVELIGGAIGAEAYAALRQGNKIYTIDDNIPLLHFLSGKTHGSNSDNDMVTYWH